MRQPPTIYLTKRERQRFNGDYGRWLLLDQKLDRNSERERIVEQRLQGARERNTAFLRAAGAVPLAPVLYASWLRDHLRSGGGVVRTERTYPVSTMINTAQGSSFGMWYASDIMTEAPAMPAGFSSERLQVFFDAGAETFRRQYFRALTDGLGSREPAEKGTHIGPFFASGEERAYGDSTIYFYPYFTTDRKGRQAVAPPYTNRPNQVVAYSDILPIIRDMTWNEIAMVEKLDEIAITGMCRAVTHAS